MNSHNHTRKRWAVFGSALSLAWLAVAVDLPFGPQPGPPVTAAQADFFETNVRPVLATQCFSCHGAANQLGGLRLDSREAILKGGDSGPAVVVGDADKSRLIQAVRQSGALKMPQGGRLKPTEVAALEAWVKMGAPWPAAVDAGRAVKGNLWSLRPVSLPPPPKVKHAATVRNPIDSFVLARLEAKGLTLAAPADRRTLLRRVTYDLTGLPPTVAELAAFLADKSPQAYDRVVDRLLASSHYGERWARLWLDVARYADTKGYVFNEDRNYYNAYTYRDWVINAFNEDMPYDRFITEQLAADRLPEVQNGDNRRPLAALGFLTVGRRFLNNQSDIIDDRIDVTMRGFEGLTVACARCHDHKFDPIPTQDYYSLYAVFNSSQEATTPISDKAIRQPWERYNSRVDGIQGQIRSLILAQVKLLRLQSQAPAGRAALSPDIEVALQAVGDGQVPEGENLKKLTTAFETAARETLGGLEKALANLQRAPPETPEFAMAMTDKPHPSDGYVFTRGHPATHGEPAPRRFLLALSKPGVKREHWAADSGRLELAQAIASRHNPLTARVFVNRVWMHHFGTGIVRTPSDFGHQGDPPTHPRLLDYLASKFMDTGWSIKKLQKLIVTSATYRQSSIISPVAGRLDPDDQLLSRMPRQRLDLEEMRDSMLAAAGRLDLSHIGGKSVDLWSEPFTGRRAIYGYIERQNLPGIFRTFDFASPDATNAQRFNTTVPQQALFFMNSPFSVEAAQSLAERPEVRSARTDSERIRSLYRLLFQRSPNDNELAVGLAYLKPGSLASMRRPLGAWRYGYGGFNESTHRISNFTTLPVFKDNVYRAGQVFPDPSLGYVMLTRTGGHPGRDGNHAVIRRWIAPSAMTVSVQGLLAHGQAQGDGVRARLVSSRLGLLGQWQVRGGRVATKVANIVVQKGDTLDFAVDPMANDAFDAFTWAPTVRSVDGKVSWDAAANFGPPAGPALERLALYAQALMMTNEFMFLD
ncbi:MAG: DUF1553 domain-containing protein [Fimbriimonadaceae bacterium]